MRPSIANPQGVNQVIEGLTKHIKERVSYLENDYGQAVKVITTENNRNKIVPAVPVEGTYIEMFPSQEYETLHFGIAHDPATIVAELGDKRRYAQDISIIVWLDQRAYDPNLTHLATDEIIQDVLTKIGMYPNCRLSQIFKEPEEVYKGFDYKIEETQFLMFPFTGFRLRYETRYTSPC